jgi:hypothetical protein
MKIGDKVLIAKKYKPTGEWTSWVAYMDNYVGRTGVITDIRDNWYWICSDQGKSIHYWFPEKSLVCISELLIKYII